MNTIVWLVLLLTVSASTFIALLVLKKNHKWLAILTAFMINTFILSVAAFWLHQIDAHTFHKQAEGLFSSLGLLVFLFFIPVITFINYCVVSYKVRG